MSGLSGVAERRMRELDVQLRILQLEPESGHHYVMKCVVVEGVLKWALYTTYAAENMYPQLQTKMSLTEHKHVMQAVVKISNCRGVRVCMEISENSPIQGLRVLDSEIMLHKQLSSDNSIPAEQMLRLMD